METEPPSFGAVPLQQQQKERLFAYLQEHVSWFYPPVSGHRSSFHDGADVDASVPAVVTLTHNADAQEVVLFCHRGGERKRTRERESKRQHLNARESNLAQK